MHDPNLLAPGAIIVKCDAIGGFRRHFHAEEIRALLALAGLKAVGLPQFNDFKTLVAARQHVPINQFAHLRIREAKLIRIGVHLRLTHISGQDEILRMRLPIHRGRNRRRMLMTAPRPNPHETTGMICRVKQLWGIVAIVLNKVWAAGRVQICRHMDDRHGQKRGPALIGRKETRADEAVNKFRCTEQSAFEGQWALL